MTIIHMCIDLPVHFYFGRKFLMALPLYTPEMAGSGQRGICVHCGKGPTPEGHDGCLGTLPEDIVMNACCGHGNNDQAYVQYWNSECVRGEAALDIIKKLGKEQ